MPDAITNAPSASDSPGEWVSVADFAKARGCSIRTVKRWIENGDVETRKDGARRFVRSIEEGHSEGTQGTQPKGHALEGVSLSRSIRAQKEGHTGHDEGTRLVSLSSEREVQLRADLERERELNRRFLELIEGHQRAEAELRATIREMAKAQPKQLTQGSATTPENGAQNGAANNVPDTMPNAPERKRTAPMTYADIADELERMMSQ